MPEETAKNTTGEEQEAKAGQEEASKGGEQGAGEAGEKNTEDKEEKKEGGEGEEQTPEEKKAAEKAIKDAEAQAKVDELATREPEVRKRKTKQDYIIERKQKKIEKMEAAQKNDDKAGADDGEGEEDDGISPEDQELINRAVDKRIAPIIEQTMDSEDEKELQDFLNDPKNSHFKPYEQVARKFMKDPSRRELPVRSIFYEVAGPDLLEIGARMSQEAKDEADRSGAGGGSDRTTVDAGKDWKNMTMAEFAEEKKRIMLANSQK